jgi:hypothetical protein
VGLSHCAKVGGFSKPSRHVETSLHSNGTTVEPATHTSQRRAPVQGAEMKRLKKCAVV